LVRLQATTAAKKKSPYRMRDLRFWLAATDPRAEAGAEIAVSVAALCVA
jgi:hypothetical protein